MMFNVITKQVIWRYEDHIYVTTNIDLYEVPWNFNTNYQIWFEKKIVFTFSIVRLCFNIVDQPIHLNFKANSMPIIIKAKSSMDPCAHTGI